MGMVGLMLSCVEEVTFETFNENLLVVDGFITDQPGPHRISIKRSGIFKDQTDGGQEEPIRGAQVSIYDDLGNVFTLDETDSGYETTEDFVGIAGRSYSICVVLDDQTTYHSEPDLLTVPEPIDDLYYELGFETFINDQNQLKEAFKVKFLVDYTYPEEEVYYKWDWYHTFIFETFCITHPEIISCNDPDPNNLPPSYCFVTRWSNDFSKSYLNIGSNKDYSIREQHGHLIHSLDLTIEFIHKYSFLVNQYGLSQDAYMFWSQVDRQLNNVGSIFDPTPTRITGNVYNVDDPEELVLGYFGAHGVTSKRIFLEFEEHELGPDHLSICDPIHGGTIAEWCSDCRLLPGSSKERPEFWQD